MQLEGKTALVTGGGRGIGRGIALAFAAEGADVAIVARSRPEPEAVVAEVRRMGRRGLVITADLTDSQDVHRTIQGAIQGLGKVDILVNNVGGYRLYTDEQVHSLPVLRLSEEEWHRVITGNLTPFCAVRPSCPTWWRGAVGPSST